MTENMKKNVKRILALGIVVLVFFLLILHFFVKNDYEISYDVKSYHVIESYHSDFQYYSFVFQHEDGKSYYILLDNQTFFDKKIVLDIEEFQNEQEICIYPKSNKARFSYLCHDGNMQLSYYSVSESMKKKIQLAYDEDNKLSRNFGKTEVYDNLKDTIFVWNYKGFTVVNHDSNYDISLFSKDIYQPFLIAQVGSILVVPDYEQDYFFDRLYLIDMNSGNKSVVNLSDKIYFDSRVLGVYDDAVYYIDKHEQMEWKFDIKKKTLESVGNSLNGKVYQHGFQEVSMNKLLYQDISFQGTTLYEYDSNHQELFQIWHDMKKKLLSDSIKCVVGSKNGTVYYLVEDSLYLFNEKEGKRLLLKNFEWNFNYSNVIFIL